MSVICSATCCGLTSNPPVPYTTCNGNKKKYNYSHIVIGDCSYQFVDITDPAEWAAAKAAGSIQCMKGKIDINAPTETVIDTDNCGGKLAVDAEYVIDFTNYYISDAEDGADATFFYELKKGAQNYWIAFLDCDLNFTLSQDYIDAIAASAVTVTGKTPGFSFSVPQTPHRINESGIMAWKTQISIEEEDVLRDVKLAGVAEVLCC